MASLYPNNYDSFVAKVDGVTEILADDVNELQYSTVALETTIGKNPQGTKSTLVDRLAISFNTDGTLLSSAVKPSMLDSSQTYTVNNFKILSLNSDNVVKTDINGNLISQGYSSTNLGGNLVQRAGDGSFSAGMITANLTGNVTGNADTVTNGVYTTSDQTISGTKTFNNTISGSITGNAGSVTNGVYITGVYSDPSWITALAGSKISGNISGNAATATTASACSGNTAGTAYNITQYTVNQNVGTGNIPTFADITLSHFSMVRVMRTTDQTLANPSVDYPILFDSVTFDRLGEYNTGTGRFTASYTGYYFVTGHLTHDDPSAVGNNFISTSIYKNGGIYALSNFHATNTYNSNTCEINSIVQLNAGEYITICGYLYPSGHLKILGSGAGVTYMCVHRIA